MVGVACRRHRQVAPSGVLKRHLVVPLEGGGGIEYLKGVNRQGVKDIFADPGTEEVIRMRRNGESTSIVDPVTHFERWTTLQVGQRGSDTKQVTLCRRHL